MSLSTHDRTGRLVYTALTGFASISPADNKPCEPRTSYILALPYLSHRSLSSTAPFNTMALCFGLLRIFWVDLGGIEHGRTKNSCWLLMYIHFICGHDSVHSSLIRYLHKLLVLGRQHKILRKPDWPPAWLDDLYSAGFGPQGILHATYGRPDSLLRFLERTTIALGPSYRLGSSDPRDQVFALLDAMPSGMRCSIQAGYSKSCREVFIDVTLKLLDGELYVLSYCELLPLDSLQ